MNINMADHTIPKCFLMSPIGGPDTDERRHADRLRDFVVRKALEPDFTIVRADDIAAPGTITAQIVRELAESQLAVADLSFTNPNVMYELAIRHAYHKPVILVCRSGQKLPFDVAAERTIFFDFREIETIEQAITSLSEQTHAARHNTPDVFNPVSLAGQAAASFASNSPTHKHVGTLIEQVSAMREELASLSLHGFQHTSDAFHKHKTSAGRPIDIGITMDTSFAEDRQTIVWHTSDDISLQHLLDHVYFLLQDIDHEIEPYTYLMDWVLVEESRGRPLIAKGMACDAEIGSVLPIKNDRAQLQVVRLNQPILIPHPGLKGISRGKPAR